MADGPWLFARLKNAVKAWNLDNNTGFTLNGPAGLVCSMVVDNDKLLAGMEDGTILMWKMNLEIKIPEPAAMVTEHKGAVCSLVIGSNRLYSGSKDTTIKGVLALCSIHDAEARPFLLCSFGDNTVRLYDLPS